MAWGFIMKNMKFKIGQIVIVKHSNEEVPIVGCIQKEGISNRYNIFVNGVVKEIFESDLIAKKIISQSEMNADILNSFITSKMIENKNADTLYSLNSAQIDFIPYQYRPVLKIIDSDLPRILIADGVGVGKTIEAGLILQELKARNDIQSVLIICPKPLVAEKKWENEMKRFGEKFQTIDGSKLNQLLKEFDKDGEWDESFNKCIIPYSVLNEDLIYGDKNKEKKSRGKKIGLHNLDDMPKFDLVIVDEAHYIKNSNSKAHQAVKLFCDSADAVVFLTATPIQLGNNDLYNILSVLRSDLFFSKDSFEMVSKPNPYINKAVTLIRESQDGWQEAVIEELSQAELTTYGRIALHANPKYKEVLIQLGKDNLSKEERVALIGEIEKFYTFHSIINRTRRRDIGNFTIRDTSALEVDFTEKQREIYEAILEVQATILARLHGNMCVKFMMTTIMRQTASCLAGLVPLLENILKRKFDELNEVGYEDYESENFDGVYDQIDIKEEVSRILEMAKQLDDKDEKFDVLKKVIDDKILMENNKVMIFSSFRHTLKYLLTRLQSAGIRAEVVHGGVADDDRLSLRARFELDKEDENAIDVLLFSEVGCEGLDYQFCDCMINYDLPWNPMRVEQRIGRIDRNGQKSEKVAIINILTKGTIDHVIYDRCLSRIGVFKESIGDCESIIGDVAKEIRSITDTYVLNKEEYAEKVRQIEDNAIREIQEKEILDKEGMKFFGLDIIKDNIENEIKNASKVHLSPSGLEKLINVYFDNVFNTHKMVTGDVYKKTIRLSKRDKDKLMQDYNACGNTKKKNSWKAYLKGDCQIYTFALEQNEKNKDIEAMPVTHPLIKQATKCLSSQAVGYVEIKMNSEVYPKGKYEFGMYEWEYCGLKNETVLMPICELDITEDEFFQAVSGAKSISVRNKFESDVIERMFYNKLEDEKQKLIEDDHQTMNLRLAHLKENHNARVTTLENLIEQATDDKIRLMKQSELKKAQALYMEKAEELEYKLDRITIMSKPIFSGVLIVE